MDGCDVCLWLNIANNSTAVRARNNLINTRLTHRSSPSSNCPSSTFSTLHSDHSLQFLFTPVFMATGTIYYVSETSNIYIIQIVGILLFDMFSLIFRFILIHQYTLTHTSHTLSLFFLIYPALSQIFVQVLDISRFPFSHKNL